MGNAIISAKTGNIYVEFPFVSTNNMQLPERMVGFETTLSGNVLATDYGYAETNREIILSFSTSKSIKDTLEKIAKDNNDFYTFSDGLQVWDIIIMKFESRYKDRNIFEISMTIRCI